MRTRLPILVVALTAAVGTACRVAPLPLVRIDTVEPGEPCPAGGVLVHSGPDEDADSVLSDDEITDTQTLCNGADGPPGEDGTPGSEGPPGADGAPIVVIDTDTTWTTDTEVSVPTLVADGATLTVAAGVTVTLLPDVELWVEGGIVLQGDEADPVVFAPAIGTLGSTVYLATDAPSTVDGVRFEHVDLVLSGEAPAEITASSFVDSRLRVRDRAGGLLVQASAFEGTSAGAATAISVDQVGSVTVNDSTFAGAANGISARGTDLSVTDSTFADIEGNAIYTTFDTPSTLTGVTVTDAGAYCVLTEGPLVLSDALVDGCRYDGVRTTSSATLTDVEVRRARYAIWHDWDEYVVDPPPPFSGSGLVVSDSLRGVWVQTAGAIDIDGATVSDIDLLECIYIEGDATLSNLDAQRCAQDGVQLVGGGSIDNVVVDDVGVYGIVANGLAGRSISASNLQISNTGHRGLWLVNAFDAATVQDVTVTGTAVSDCAYVGSLSNTISRLTLSDCANDGLVVQGGGTVTDLTVSSTGGDGAQFNTSPASVTMMDAAITDAAVRGIYAVTLDALSLDGVVVTNSGNDGIYSNAARTTITGSAVVDSGAQGIEVQGPEASLTDVLVDGTASYGVWIEQGELDYVEITKAGGHGLYVDGWGPGFVQNSNIVGNTLNGVRCRHSNDPTRSMFDVLSNNIADNLGEWDLRGTGVDHCRLVDGNYIAFNGAAEEVDDRDDRGTLDDGVRDSDGQTDNNGTQIEDVDRIDTYADAPLTGTGPRN